VGGFKVVNRVNGFCLSTVTGPVDHSNVFISSCATSGSTLNSQSWTFEAVAPTTGSRTGTPFRLHGIANPNVCVASLGSGSSLGGNENDDVVVLSCNASGQQQWYATR
jgi:hypothetical protein